MFRSLLCFGILLAIFSPCHAQEEWVLKSDKDQIKAWSKNVKDSKINAVKVEAVFTASLTQLAAVLLDVGSYDKWVYNSKSTRILKQVSPSELYYYSEVSFPWPTTNRDFVSHMILTQDPRTKVVRIDAKNVPGWVPVDKSIVRIEKSSGEWTITPLPRGQLRIEYILQVDPGGVLPAWLINSFSSKGLIETFKNLKEWVKRPVYASARLPFVSE